MTEDTSSSVLSAFEILLEEIEAEIDHTNSLGSQAFEKRDYESVQEIATKAAALTSFRDRVANLREEWASFSVPEDDDESGAERRNLGRLRKGVRTSESAYRIPILQTLVESGGRAKVGDLLERVHDRMRSVLGAVDYEPLASDPSNPRWRNAAQWARHGMVQEGLLKANSPRGIWEISERGREYLERFRRADAS